MLSPPKFESPKNTDNESRMQQQQRQQQQYQSSGFEHQDTSSKNRQAISNNSTQNPSVRGFFTDPFQKDKQQQLPGDQQLNKQSKDVNSSNSNNQTDKRSHLSNKAINGLIFGPLNEKDNNSNKNHKTNNNNTTKDYFQGQDYQHNIRKESNLLSVDEDQQQGGMKSYSFAGNNNNNHQQNQTRQQTQHSQLQQTSIISRSGHMTATEYLYSTGAKQNCQIDKYPNESCSCSESSWALVRDQLRELKQLSSEHLFATQENSRLKEQNESISQENVNLKNQVIILEQKMQLYEKESMNKLTTQKDKTRQLESFNKDLFNKISYLEATIVNYETELKAVKQEAVVQIQSIQEERDFLKQSLENLHDTMNEAIQSAEQKQKAKLDEKNSKLKKLKQQGEIDRELIESYQTELLQMQAENQNLQGQIQNLQARDNSVQFDLEQAINKIQAQDQQLQSSFKKIEELENHIQVLISTQHFEGEDKLKAFQQLNEQQLNSIANENQELKAALDNIKVVLQQTTETNRLESQQSALLVKSIVQQLVDLLDNRGRIMEGEQENEYLEYGLSKENGGEVFELLREKIHKLLDSRHALKKKKRQMQDKNDDLKEEIEDLKQTIHQLVNERQQELLINDHIAILQQQQQQQQQHSLYLAQQDQFGYNNNNNNNSQFNHASSPLHQSSSAHHVDSGLLTGETAQFHTEGVLYQQQQQQNSMNSGIHNTSAQFLQPSSQQTRQNQREIINIQSQQSTQLNNQQQQQHDGEDIQQQQYQIHINSFSNNNNNNMNSQPDMKSQQYQTQIEEILAMKDRYYKNILNETNISNTVVLFNLCQMIVISERKKAMMGGLMKQLNNILLGILDSLDYLPPVNKFKAIVLQVIFIRRLKKNMQMSKSKGGLVGIGNSTPKGFLEKQSPSSRKILSSELLVQLNFIKQSLQEDDIDMFNQLTYALAEDDNSEIKQNHDDVQQLLGQDSEVFKKVFQILQRKCISYQQEYSKIQSKNVLKEIKFHGGNQAVSKLATEKEMIEAENVHLKKLIVSMSDEKEELQKTLGRYEHLIDQNNREMLTRQPILNDVFSFNPPRSSGSIHNHHQFENPLDSNLNSNNSSMQNLQFLVGDSGSSAQNNNNNNNNNNVDKNNGNNNLNTQVGGNGQNPTAPVDK